MSEAQTVGASWWSKLMAFSALLAVLLLLSGPFGYRFGVTELLPSLISILVAFVGAVLVLLVSVVLLIMAIRGGLLQDRNLLFIALAIGLLPVLVVAPQVIAARSVPPIHDISTDTVDPPQFSAIVALRAGSPNDLIYEMEGSAEKLAEVQRSAYADVQTLNSSLSVADAVARASTVLEDMGLEIVNVDANAGLVEATATTFWFQFKDDVVVRVTPAASGSSIDLRSVSRVGQSDIGANAARILAFTAAF